MARSEPRLVEVNIHAFSKKGNGLGRGCHENGVAFEAEVPFTMPGDVVKAYIQRKRNGVFTGKLEEIVRPAPLRIVPRCVHFGVCGGCRWQEIPYEEQLRNKEEIVRNSFKNLMTADVEFHPIVPSPKAWEYRNKMEFSFSSDLSKKKYLGLMMDSGRGKVLSLTECHLVNPWFIEALKVVHLWWNESTIEAYYPPKNTGALRTLTVREGMRSGDRMIVLTVSGNPDYALNKQQIESFVAFLRDAIEPIDPEQRLSIYLRIQQIAKGQPTQFYEMHLYGAESIRETLNITMNTNEKPFALTFTVSPSAFFQPNSAQAEQLYSLAFQMAQIPKNAVVYDLYCGTGTLGICAARFAKQVVGIELSAESSLDARENAKYNKIDNIEIITDSVDKALKRIHEEKNWPMPDVVMVDPPRVGLEEDALNEIVSLNAPKIVYISCNPATQAANVAELIKKGYKIVAIQPVDQFPQTVHIENIILLCRH